MTKSEKVVRDQILESVAALIESLVNEDGYMNSDMHLCGWDECCADYLPAKISQIIRDLKKKRSL